MSYQLDFETLVAIRSKQALDAFDPEKHTWNWACEHGYLDVVKFLHENRTEGCTTDAMDSASENGHLDIVKFLHENRTEGCTTDAMVTGHLNIVQWLREHT